MSFFGAVFAALTLYWQWHLAGAVLVLPFIVFVVGAAAAGYVIRLPGAGIEPSERTGRVIMWSSIGEGIGLFVGSNVVINLHHPELLLPVMGLVVGLHFLPIAYSAAFRPLYILGIVLICGAVTGFVVPPPVGGGLAGCMSAAGLWTAAGLAIVRDWRWKVMTSPGQKAVP